MVVLWKQIRIKLGKLERVYRKAAGFAEQTQRDFFTKVISFLLL